MNRQTRPQPGSHRSETRSCFLRRPGGNTGRGSLHPNRRSSHLRQRSGLSGQGSAGSNQGSDNLERGSGTPYQGSGGSEPGSGSLRQGSGNLNQRSGGLEPGSGGLNQRSGGLERGSGNSRRRSGNPEQGSDGLLQRSKHLKSSSLHKTVSPPARTGKKPALRFGWAGGASGVSLRNSLRLCVSALKFSRETKNLHAHRRRGERGFVLGGTAGLAVAGLAIAFYTGPVRDIVSAL
jgi:hypothetical protein